MHILAGSKIAAGKILPKNVLRSRYNEDEHGTRFTEPYIELYPDWVHPAYSLVLDEPYRQCYKDKYLGFHTGVVDVRLLQFVLQAYSRIHYTCDIYLMTSQN